MKIAQNVTELIGNTPLVKINSISNETNTIILGKCEFLNPTSSVKDRIALAMIDAGIADGKINKETLIIEPTSGNTGIGLAMVCASKGLKLTLTMPESMSLERRQLLSALGANIVLTPAALGMKGAIDKAAELNEEDKNSFMPQQFNNSANPAVHKSTTAQEILRDTDGKIDILVAAVGTGGSLTGIGEALKENNPNIEIIAVEPTSSPVISGGKAGPHKIQGIGAGFIPKVLNTEIINEVIQVSDEDAFATSKALAKNDGLLVGISAGANAHAARLVASREHNRGKTIVTILCDTGERYLSTALYS
ncbi:MAG: cysteine synthase A [Sulfurimonas sp.]|uniref:cysteine synthase A n=1 Tax=Sulfurimonas sp. TaxID=2022749 RepID=UPI0025EAFD75|nr:cysteine synthase A [Sulfurimonas sp.]MCK9491248.1 cysteine synthase A [Sulfurimonas sp.]